MKSSQNVRRKALATLWCVAAIAGISATAKAEALKDYEKTVEVSGTVIGIGSDTLANLMNFGPSRSKSSTQM